MPLFGKKEKEKNEHAYDPYKGRAPTATPVHYTVVESPPAGLKRDDVSAAPVQSEARPQQDNSAEIEKLRRRRDVASGAAVLGWIGALAGSWLAGTYLGLSGTIDGIASALSYSSFVMLFAVPSAIRSY